MNSVFETREVTFHIESETLNIFTSFSFIMKSPCHTLLPFLSFYVTVLYDTNRSYFASLVFTCYNVINNFTEMDNIIVHVFKEIHFYAFKGTFFQKY